MNANQIINMVVRMVIRKVVRGGVNAGMNAVSNRMGGDKTDGKDVPGAAEANKRTKQSMRMMRKLR